MNNTELITKAKSAEQCAHSPYSKIKVGAALLCKNGKIYTGCNVENASYAATICAERTAIAKAISEGERDFEAIAITSTLEEITPCGICLQTLTEFAPQIKIITQKKGKPPTAHPLSKHLPTPFSL